MQAARNRQSSPRGRWYPRQAAIAQRWVALGHVLMYRASGGLLGGQILGCPVLLLTTVGFRSRQLRTTPLFYLPDGDAMVLVASNGGTAADPLWYRNLQRYPAALVELGRDHRRVAARTADDAEAQRLWPRLVAMFPPYAAYQRRTSRPIPLVLLERPSHS